MLLSRPSHRNLLTRLQYLSLDTQGREFQNRPLPDMFAMNTGVFALFDDLYIYVRHL